MNTAKDTHINLPHAVERANFASLLLANPNYFGTLHGAGEVVTPLSGITAFEELGCVGLNPASGNPAQAVLAGVINILQQGGYDGGPCGTGSIEYVRFYAQAGTGWTDLGLAGVNVFDLAGSTLPVSYAVSLPIDQPEKYCFVENVISVRAILSWNYAPPANTPDFVPVFGNVVQALVQLPAAPFYKVPISALVGDGLVTLDPAVAQAIDLAQPLPGAPVEALSPLALKKLYEGMNVPPHRYLFPVIAKYLEQPSALVLQAGQAGKLTIGGLNAGGLFGKAGIMEGDTSYEELVCAGYNPQTRTLEAVVRIVQDSGYSGGLCTAGSQEYVGFYGYIAGAWVALGVASVTVHDLAAVASDGPVNYAVLRVSPATSMPCETLVSVPLRAILSWQTPPTSENYIPVWGNVLNTNIQPQIGTAVTEGNAELRLLRINAVAINGYAESGGEWLATWTGNAEDCTDADQSPVGSNVFVEGDISPKASGLFDPVAGTVLPGAYPMMYQAFITRPDSSILPLTNAFDITVQPAAGPEVNIVQTLVPPYGPVSGGAAGATYYTYYESDLQLVVTRTMAVFPADGLSQGNYSITVTAFVWDGVQYNALPAQSQSFYVYNGYLTSGETGDGAPELSLNFTSAVDCGNITVGDTVTGAFAVTDEFFRTLTIELTPISIDNVPVTMPAVSITDSHGNTYTTTVSYDGTNTGGVSGTFSFPTAGLPACGYTLVLAASDRALLADSCEGHYAQEAVGFCLVAALD